MLDRTDDLATRKSFRTLFSIQVRLEALVALLYTDQLTHPSGPLDTGDYAYYRQFGA